MLQGSPPRALRPKRLYQHFRPLTAARRPKHPPQDFKFVLLQLPEAQQRLHFGEVQRQALGGRLELARRWVGRLLGRQQQGAAEGDGDDT